MTIKNFNVKNGLTTGNITLDAATGNVTGINYVTANYVIGNASQLSSIAGANVTGYVPLATAANTAGTVTTAAQPNITSVGTLTSLSVTGNVGAGNLKTDNLLYANGSPYVFTTNAAGSNTYVQFNDSNSFAGSAGFTFDKGTNALSVSGNITGGNISGTLVGGTLTTAAQPNITSLGTITDLTVSNGTAYSNVYGNGAIVTSGNVTAPYFIGNVVGNISGTITVPGSNTAVLFNNNGNAGASDAFKFNFGSNTLTVTGNVIASNVDGGNLVSANYFSGDGSLLTSITGANVTGYVANATSANSATTAGTVTTAAQPNITSVGTLSSLSVTGLTTATGGVKTSNIQDSSGTNTISVSSSTVGIVGNLEVGTGGTGNVTATNFIGNIVTAAQPNITSVGTLTSLSVTGNVSANYFIGNGSTLTNITGANVTGYVPLATASNTAGTVTTAAQPNITSVGTLTTLNVGGNIDVTGNINVTGNLNYSNVSDLVVGDPLIYIGANNTGNLYDLGIVASYNDGSYYHTGLARNASDGAWTLFDKVVAEPTTVIDWANATPATFKAGNANITGNVNAGAITLNGSTGNVTSVNYLTANYITGTLTTASQPNITSVGTLSGLTVTGVVDATGASNVSLGPVGNVHITGGSSGYLLQTDGSGTLTWVAPPSTSSVTNGTSNVSIPTVNGNVNTSVGGTANVVVVTSTGMNVSGYMTTTGNITSGNASLGNLAAANYFQGNGSLLTSITGANVTGYVPNATAANTAGTVTTAAQPNITSVGTLTSLSVTGNVTANYFIGNGATLTNIAGANVTGQVANALIAGTVYTAAQPNITSVGTLTTLSVTGNVTANYFIGNGATLTNIAGANVTGQVSNALIAGTVYVNAQPNITSVGTLTSLTVSGNLTTGNLITSGSGGNISDANYVIANYFSGNGSLLTSLNASNLSSGTISGTILGNSTLYIGTTSIALNRSSGSQSLTGITSIDGYASSANTAGTVTTAAQPNITSVGTLTSLSVTGNVTANYFIGNGATLTNITGANVTGQVGNALIAGTVYTAAQPNITSVGTLTSLVVSGNATVGNSAITGGITSNRANVSVSTNTVIDEFSPTAYRTAKYVVSASSTNGYQSAEIILVHNGTSSYISIYGSVCSNATADIVDFSSNINGVSGNVTVYATGTSATLNLVATYLKT